jgi:hypothetical protein
VKEGWGDDGHAGGDEPHHIVALGQHVLQLRAPAQGRKA